MSSRRYSRVFGTLRAGGQFGQVENLHRLWPHAQSINPVPGNKFEERRADVAAPFARLQRHQVLHQIIDFLPGESFGPTVEILVVSFNQHLPH